MNVEQQRKLWDATAIWAPSYPRKVSNEQTIQTWANDRAELVDNLRRAADAGQPGFISTYSFPRGHSKGGNVPSVDGIFIDLDVPGGDYDPDTGAGGIEAWKRDMSALLARARVIAQNIIDSGYEDRFLASLSGHKGIHIDLTFPEISPNEGSFHQFKNGLSEYGDEVVERFRNLSQGVDIDPWVDVDSSDLGRLRRMPNTPHNGTNHVDSTKWCVPVTIRELSTMYPNDYLALTNGPREITNAMRREPSERDGQSVVQRIRSASDSSYSSGSTTRFDPRAVEAYEDESNDDLTLDDIKFLTQDRPCIWSFRERDDAYDHGMESRQMELNVMARMIELSVPIDVMCEFFEPIDGYDEEYTRNLIEDLIGRGNNGYNSFNCETITDRAAEFCHGNSCSVYRRNDDLVV